MEIKNINGRDYSSIPTSVHSMIKNTEKILDGSLTRFIDGATPIIMNYYSYDNLASVTGVGDKSTHGPYSGATKYKLIKDYIGYGYVDEKNTTLDKNEKEDVKLNTDILSFLHLPNTITPVMGDRLTLKLENHQIFYVVTNLDYVTLHNKTFIKVDYMKDDNCPEQPWTYEHMKRRKLISQEFKFVQENLGTQYSPFLEESTYIELQKIIEKREEINEIYMSYFYDDYTNMLRVETKDKLYLYSPLLYYFQMEFFPLKIYETNDLMLSNEAIEDKMTIVKWKTHPFKKFINRKGDQALNSVELYKYKYYSQKQDDPYHKINTYMNSMDEYEIYDIVPNDDKKPESFEPPQEIRQILEMWYNNQIDTGQKVLEVLEELYLEEVTMEYMLYTPLLLAVIDRIYQELYTRVGINRFY